MRHCLALFALGIICTFSYPSNCDKFGHRFEFKDGSFDVVGDFLCKEGEEWVDRLWAIEKYSPAKKVNIGFIKKGDFGMVCESSTQGEK